MINFGRTAMVCYERTIAIPFRSVHREKSFSVHIHRISKLYLYSVYPSQIIFAYIILSSFVTILVLLVNSLHGELFNEKLLHT